MKNLTFCRLFLSFLPFSVLTSGYTLARDEQLILPGAEQTQEYLDILQHKNVGIVINQTSLVGTTPLCDTLLALGVSVYTIFTPEHGFFGSADAGEWVGDGIFNPDSIKIVSLYGKKKKPDTLDMQGIDIMVFDLQDVGARFYTYLSTLHYVMEACAENKVPLIVLDRPNPNGFYIDGPVLEKKYTSFVGLHPVPVVYGMTIGEYACMINGEYWLKDSVQCKLTVIPCSNYDHNSRYALPVNPSPNLPTMRSVYLYPSLALFEGTIVSLSKGTDYPFLVIGHPDYPDHQFSFIPVSKKGSGMNPLYRDKTCYGIDLREISVDSLATRRSLDINYLIHFYNSLDMGDQFFNSFFEKLAGTIELRKQIMDGMSAKEIQAGWKPGLEEFKKIRVKYLLYPDFSE